MTANSHLLPLSLPFPPSLFSLHLHRSARDNRIGALSGVHGSSAVSIASVSRNSSEAPQPYHHRALTDHTIIALCRVVVRTGYVDDVPAAATAELGTFHQFEGLSEHVWATTVADPLSAEGVATATNADLGSIRRAWAQASGAAAAGASPGRLSASTQSLSHLVLLLLVQAHRPLSLSLSACLSLCLFLLSSLFPVHTLAPTSADKG